MTTEGPKTPLARFLDWLSHHFPPWYAKGGPWVCPQCHCIQPARRR